MKKALINKAMLCMLMVVMLLTLLQGFSFAKSENVQMIKKSEKEYLIYVSGLNQEFDFAFSNNSDIDKTTLIFKDSALDKTENGNHIAYIDSSLYTEYFKDQTKTYLWVKQGEEYKLEAEQLILTDALSQEDIEEFNSVTKKFYNGTEQVKIEVGQKELPQEETTEGVTITRKIGTLNIVNGGETTYSYKMVRATEGSDAEKLIKLAEEMNKLNELDENAMFEKLSVYSEFKTVYNKLVPTVNDENWAEVKESTIEQPQGSKTGEQYLVWMKQESEEQNPVIDVQIMTCKDEYKEEYEKQEVIIKETTKLPITGDNVVLFVIAGIVIALISVVLILKNKDSKKSKHSA